MRTDNPGKEKVQLNDILDLKLLETIPESLIRRHRAIPIARDGRRLTVAMSDPFDAVAIDDLRLVTGNEIRPVYVSAREIDSAIQKCFGLSGLKEALQGFEVVEVDTVQLDKGSDNSATEAPIIRLVNMLIVQAIEGRASDIHIEPMGDSVKVRYRIDGILREKMSLPSNSRSAIISRVKVLAQLNIAERRLPQDGRIKIKYQNRDIDLRISTIPVVFGEKVVIRILDKESGLFKMDRLGFSEENLKTFRSMLGRSHGMLLITGPTGSGKTTTLYSALNEMDIAGKNIITIEDPVEYIIDGVNQVQVNSRTGLTFATGLRSIIRQDPDIIMVGEIRDAETARIAVHAATTGQLVLSTLHTNDAKGAVTRLFDMGIEPYLATTAITGVIAQRLVRRLCIFCREPYVVKSGTPESAFIGEMADGNIGNITLYRAVGCDNCNGTGFWGRIGIQEVLPVMNGPHPLFVKHNAPEENKELSLGVGAKNLKTDGTKKAIQGLTTIQEIMRTCSG